MKSYFKKFIYSITLVLCLICIFAFTSNNVAKAQDLYTDNLIPKMTGYTNGNITVSSDNYYTDIQNRTHDAWHAFDRSTNDNNLDWFCNSNVLPAEGYHWIKVDFTNPKSISKITIACTYSHSSVNNFKLQGSNDDNIWKDVYKGINTRYDGAKSEFEFNNENYYRYYRILVMDSYSSYGKTYCGIDELEMMEKKSTSISLNKYVDNLQAGQDDNLIASTTPAGAKVTWTSDNTGIATVDSDGKVTGVKEGTCTITATTADGLTATCTVTVTKAGTDPTEPTGDETLFIELVDGQTKEYHVTSDEIDKFIDWYKDRDKDDTKSKSPYYKFKKDSNNTDYVVQAQIDWFEVRKN